MLLIGATRHSQENNIPSTNPLYSWHFSFKKQMERDELY